MEQDLSLILKLSDGFCSYYFCILENFHNKKIFLRGLMNEIENRTTQDYRLIYNYNS
jgi:hypothetical protein